LRALMGRKGKTAEEKNVLVERTREKRHMGY